MTDKFNNTDKNPVTEFASTFVSDPKIIKNPADYGDYDEFHLVPFNDLLNDNDETNPRK